MKTSAGILAYRFTDGLEVFLVHPGGPFFKAKDLGVWTIPKGEYTADEDPFVAAQREFVEETGHALNGTYLELLPVKQKSGKQVTAWAIEQEIDADKITSNTFSIQWPPKSGRLQTFPEVDKAAWFAIPLAKQKIIPAQVPFINQLIEKLMQQE